MSRWAGLMAMMMGSTALAAPDTLLHQGRLLDGAGVPVNGSHTLDVRLYGTLSATTPIHSETVSVDFADGYYAVNVGPVDIQGYPQGLWVGLAIDGGTELNRSGAGTVPYALSVDRSWNGLRLDGELAGLIDPTGGATALDPTAHGGQVRLAGVGDSGRIWGINTGYTGGPLASVSATVTLRAKVSANTSGAPFGEFVCTANRGGSWQTLDSTGTLSPSRFTQPSVWQEFRLTCPWDWADTDQFVGWEGFANAGTDLSIDYVTVHAGAASTPSQRWVYHQTGGLNTGSATAPLPGLQGLSFTLHSASQVSISYSMQVHNLHDYTDQHCAVLMYMNGATSPLGDASHGSGFLMPGASDGSDRQKWWDYAVFEEVLSLPAGRHTVSMSGRVSSGSNDCRFSNLYGGGQVIVHASAE